MKFAILIFTFFISLSSIAQFRISDGLDFEIPIPKEFHSYSLYWYPYF